MQSNYSLHDTIVALSTPPGIGAIGLLRLSGSKAIEMVDGVFSKKSISSAKGYTVHYGHIADEQEVIDEVLISIFKAPHSYTGDDVVEISAHGSPYIINRLLQLFLNRGARLAQPGEFTMRAYLNGKMDLAQAEAVADIIQAQTAAAHRIAMTQLRGGFSADIARLRQSLIDFASLLELELDFSEEDVEFANRSQLKNTLIETNTFIHRLLNSFRAGNAIKNGIPTMIVGKPNAGKSTLLNALLNEEKAIVSDIPGTTRDFIEDILVIEGIAFRFIDTAGLRHTTDVVEAMGVERTIKKMESAAVIIYLFDTSNTSIQDILDDVKLLKTKQIPYILVGNKIDLDHTGNQMLLTRHLSDDLLFISALNQTGIEQLKKAIFNKSGVATINQEDVVVTNARHVEALQKAYHSVEQCLQALDSGLSTDLLSEELRMALHAIGEITGEITNDELLGNIFSRFCIGK